MLSPRGFRAGVTSTTVRCAAIALALGLASVVAGCSDGGFRPLYGTTSGVGAPGDARLARVDIVTIPGRVGQRIRNELVFERNSSTPVPMDRRLEVKITESILTTLVTITGNSSGQVYQLEATYRLIDTTTQKVVFEGRSLGRASFERFESIYSNVRAREDAENRAAASVAGDIRTRLVAHLSRA